mmetsp:Transcript_1222/g.5179  ORF Transcript_1222/g.5179 Transcript_1222/m.5179 type:complete len:261 (+) Transcript_1222:1064-1846(+)
MYRSAGFSLAVMLSPSELKCPGASSTVPAYAIRPRARRMSLSKDEKMVYDGWWIVQMMVRFNCSSPTRSLRMRTTSSAILESNPDVASSTKTTAGSVSSSMPMETRLRCPPLIPFRSTLPTRTSAQSSRLSLARMPATRALRALADTLRRSAAVYPSVSLGVRPARSTSSCGMKQAICLKLAGMGPSLTVSVPLRIPLEWLCPASTLSSVVLPAPLGPMSATSSPGRKVTLSSLSRALGTMLGNSHQVLPCPCRSGTFTL